ncbi:MAG: hypothetical protein KQH79_01095 [Bacteroidetes bacterium]|nr:hypothetical protein [Bacteroidota bacterium]
MNNTNITIEREIFNTLSPKTYNHALFSSDDDVRIISVSKDKLLPWGKAQVPAMEIEVNGREMEVPVNVILGSVISKPNVLHNEGQGDLECVDFVGNTLFDYLKSENFDQEDVIKLPGQIKIIKRVNKGIPKDQVNKKKVLYEESFLVKPGNSFDSQFDDLEFIPTIFKSALGRCRTNGTYLIAPID